ncbi:MAG: hypothetical protein M3211_06665 [Actinomycetota bacterium]|nr:hypothetical protein [Actinomycetota bacterium]
MLASTLVVGSVLIAVPSSAKVPRLPHRYPSAIEQLADYSPQRKCSPSAKRGTVAFANMLLRTYKFSRSLGIVRSCGVGGTSEHKEGRAFDWGVNAHRKRDRRAVKGLMHWLLKRDRHGNRYANARRLGIQYMIWNRRIWGAYSASSGWRRYTGSSPHTDHVHFSLSWQGARKKTSFWNPRRFSDRPRPPKPNNPKPNNPKPNNPKPNNPGPSKPEPRNPKPGGKLLPEPRSPRSLADGRHQLRSERVFVPAQRRFGVRTKGALEAGHQYLIEASGTFRYGKHARAIADAECSTAPRSSWRRDRTLVERQRSADHLDLYVDGHDLYADAESGDDCDRGNHTYRWVYQAERDGRAPLRIWDPRGHRNNKGALRVRVTDMSVDNRMTWRVPADQAIGATSPGSLQAGVEYEVTVSGEWSPGDGFQADAECSIASWESTWERDRWGGDPFDVLQDLDDIGLEPVVDTGDNCNAENHTYSYRFTPSETRPVNFRVDDPSRYGDNSGRLTVSIKRYVEPAPEPEPEPEQPQPIVPETVTVDSTNPSAVRTQQSYPAGTELRLTATGSYRAHERIQADVECAAWRREDGTWSDWGNHFGGDYDVTVNGVASTWWPHDGGTCDADHAYSRDITVEQAGRVRLQVADPWDYSDNEGSLTVTVEPR